MQIIFSAIFAITVCASCLAASDALKHCTLLYNPLTLNMSNDSSVVVSILGFFSLNEYLGVLCKIHLPVFSNDYNSLSTMSVSSPEKRKVIHFFAC